MASGRPYHHGNLRQALLVAAMIALRDGGAEALSLRELARAVGVSHAAPRRHFPDRKALLDALAIEGFGRLGDDLGAAAAEHGATDGGGADGAFQPTLRRCAHAYVSFATTDAALLEVMFAGKHTPTVDGAAERAFSPIRGLIRRGQADGSLLPGDPERVGLLLLSTIHGIAALRNVGMIAPQQLAGLVDDAIAHFLRGSREVVTDGTGLA